MNMLKRLALALTVVFTTSASAGAEDYARLNPDLSTAPLPYLTGGMQIIERRMQGWDRALQQQDLGVQRIVSGPYGSAFLPVNRKGLDLDYMALFDFGVWPEEPAPQLAEKILDRVSRVMEAIAAAERRAPRSAAFYVTYDGPLAELRDPAKIAAARTVVAEQLAHGATSPDGKGFFTDAAGRQIPAHLRPFEVVIPFNTKLRMLSDRVRYYQDMFPGVRTITVQLFFTVALRRGSDIRCVNLAPLYDKGAHPIGLFEMGQNMLFRSPAQADLFQRRIAHLPQPEISAALAGTLYAESLGCFEREDFLKQLKRMYQCYASIRSAFSADEQTEFEDHVRRLLLSDWAVVLSDLPEQAGVWRGMDAAARAVFVRAGDLQRLRKYARHAAAIAACAADSAEREDCRAALELSKIAAELQPGAGLDEALRRLAEVGERLFKQTGPSRVEMAGLFKTLEEKLHGLGYRKLSLYAARDGRLRIRRDELAREGLDPQQVNLPPGAGGIPPEGGYTYQVIDRPKDGEQPLKLLVFRLPAARSPRA